MAGEDNFGFGVRLRAMRKQRRLTLKQVADACGLAISTLSRVERGQMSPTYDKLLQLAQGLGVDLAELFGSSEAHVPSLAETPRSAVSHLGQEYRVSTPNYDYRYLCPTLAGKSMVPAAAQVKTRSLTEFGPLIRHAGEEFLFVLAGRVEVYLEGKAPIILNAGESIYFDASLGHAFLYVGEHPAEILVVLSGDDRRQPFSD